MTHPTTPRTPAISFERRQAHFPGVAGATQVGSFPKNHNLILIGQVELLSNLDLVINQDIKSRVTYSVVTRRLHDDVMREFIHRELDRLGLAHSMFTSGATELIIRSADGVLRRCRNLCLSAMLEAVRASAGRTIDIDVVNRVLLQPHWQNQVDLTNF